MTYLSNEGYPIESETTKKLWNKHLPPVVEKATEKQVGGDHYKDCPIQPTEYIIANKLGWCEGNAVKYITRHRRKGGKESILKAIHYLEMLLENEYS